MKVLGKICGGLEWFCKNICILLFIVMTFSAATQVVTRMVFGSAWGWTDEMCRYTLVWTAFFSASYGVRKGSHLAIDIIINAVPRIVQKAFSICSLCITMVAAYFLVRYGFELSLKTFGSRSTVLNLPIGGVYLAIPLSGILIFIFAVVGLIELVSGKKITGEEETA